MILRLLTQHYQLDDLYIPPREVGRGLPEVIINFYHNLVEQVREALVKEEKEEQVVTAGTDTGSDVKTTSSTMAGYGFCAAHITMVSFFCNLQEV